MPEPHPHARFPVRVQRRGQCPRQTACPHPPRRGRAAWVASSFMYTPLSSAPGLMIPAHVNGVRRIIEADPSRNAFSVPETFAMNDAFSAELERRAVDEIPANGLDAKLRLALTMPKG